MVRLPGHRRKRQGRINRDRADLNRPEPCIIHIAIIVAGWLAVNGQMRRSQGERIKTTMCVKLDPSPFTAWDE